MAQRALPPGVVRRRAMFGLLDADGWLLAGLKGLFWFVLIMFLLGYIPDRAYYFTVFPTIDVGANVISPINFCPPSNRNLPCPAPNGAVVPWQPSPTELALPEARTGAATVQSGTVLYLVGGTVGEAATSEVLETNVTPEGNFAPWRQSEPLPAARSGAAVVSFSGVPYVIGGTDENGAETDTVLAGVIAEGAITGWEMRDASSAADLSLPKPLSDAAAVTTATGIYLLGGRSGGELSASVYRLLVSASVNPPSFRGWEEVAQLPLPEARADGAGVAVGNTIYLLGGEGPGGVTNSVFRLELDSDSQPVIDPATGQPRGWASTTTADQSLPAPRAGASGFSANSIVYLIGGRDAAGAPTSTTYWAVPETDGDFAQGWRELDASNLPEPRADAAVAVAGSHAFVIGGSNADGPTTSSLRSSLAPAAPFFRLGLFGATIPALSIQGEIGQQLGYLSAAGAATVNFILLVLIGLAYSHRRQTRRVLERISGGRYRAPREDDDYPL